MRFSTSVVRPTPTNKIRKASGSARGPAANHGIYGFRPSFCSTAMDGVVPSSMCVDVLDGIEKADLSAQTF